MKAEEAGEDGTGTLTPGPAPSVSGKSVATPTTVSASPTVATDAGSPTLTEKSSKQ